MKRTVSALKVACRRISRDPNLARSCGTLLVTKPQDSYVQTSQYSLLCSVWEGSLSTIFKTLNTKHHNMAFKNQSYISEIFMGAPMPVKCAFPHLQPSTWKIFVLLKHICICFTYVHICIYTYQEARTHRLSSYQPLYSFPVEAESARCNGTPMVSGTQEAETAGAQSTEGHQQSKSLNFKKFLNLK